MGRNLKPLTIGTSTELSLQPQFMLQRAVDGDFNNAGDLFGVDAKLRGYGAYKLSADADIEASTRTSSAAVAIGEVSAGISTWAVWGC